MSFLHRGIDCLLDRALAHNDDNEVQLDRWKQGVDRTAHLFLTVRVPLLPERPILRLWNMLARFQR